MQKNNPLEKTYITRSNEQQIAIIKSERVENIVKRTEYIRLYENVLEKYILESNEEMYIKLENEWKRKSKQLEGLP